MLGELREKGRRIGFDIGARCDDDAVVKAHEDCKEATPSLLLATRNTGWMAFPCPPTSSSERSPANPSSATSRVFIHFGHLSSTSGEVDGYHFLIQSVSLVRGGSSLKWCGVGLGGIFCVGEAARCPPCVNVIRSG